MENNNYLVLTQDLLGGRLPNGCVFEVVNETEDGLEIANKYLGMGFFQSKEVAMYFREATEEEIEQYNDDEEDYEFEGSYLDEEDYLEELNEYKRRKAEDEEDDEEDCCYED